MLEIGTVLSLFTDEETKAWRDEVTCSVSYRSSAECSQSPLHTASPEIVIFLGGSGCGWVWRERLDHV